MSQNEATIEKQHLLFIKEVSEAELVWGLHCKDGWSNADSCEFEQVVVYPFWSNPTLAKTCAVQDWAIYEPKSLELPEFLENWCVGMFKEYILAGTNWDADLEGKEIDPLDLALQIVQELKRQKKQLKFKLYRDLAEYEKMLQDVIEEERSTL